MINPSCCKKLMAKFRENEWDGLLFCEKRCFKHHKKSLEMFRSFKCMQEQD